MEPLDGVIWACQPSQLMTGLTACPTPFTCPVHGSSWVRVGESFFFPATLSATSLPDPGGMTTHVQATQGPGTESDF